MEILITWVGLADDNDLIITRRLRSVVVDKRVKNSAGPFDMLIQCGILRIFFMLLWIDSFKNVVHV